MPSAVHKSFVLLSCTFLGLICGTLYLYSSYSPQLALRLHYSATDSSSIALVGSLGIAVAGPLSGVVVDRKGYTPPLFIGGLCILAGYAGLRHQFVAQHSQLAVLCVLLFLVGCGSTFINLVCLKCCAVTFPSLRGVATLLPLALYGLLAMFFSVVASLFFPGDTPGFFGFVIVSLAVIFAVCSPAIVRCDMRTRREVVEMTESKAHAAAPQLAGVGVLRLLRFWLLFFITGALAALGQMYIYLVGYMAKALVTQNYALSPEADQLAVVDVVIQQQQQLQVGLLSIANCVGRLAAGVMGDIIVQSFHKPRGWLLFVPALGLTATQLMGRSIARHESLGAASMLSGFFYGYSFCIMPIIVGDVFGMDNFSGNWGLVGLAPVVPSFYFTSLFGKVYDLKSVATAAGTLSCTLGRKCYAQVFTLGLAVAVLAVLVVGVFNFGERYRASRALYERRKLSVPS